jgi:hypothetical protein
MKTPSETPKKTAAECSREGKLKRREQKRIEALKELRTWEEPMPWRPEPLPGFDRFNVLKGFVFADDLSRENALWAFLWALQARVATPGTIFRPPAVVIIGGPMTGKSELIRRMGGEFAGSLPNGKPMMTQWLNGIAEGREALMVLDLVDARLMKSQELASFITAREWQYRLLGKTEMVTTPLRCLTVATASHEVTLSDEMRRRCIVIRLKSRARE